MNPSGQDARMNAARLLRDIFDTHHELLDEVALFQQMVDATQELLSDEELQQQYPQLWQHLRFDPDIRAEYRLLVELLQDEKAGQLVRLMATPPMPPLRPDPPQLENIKGQAGQWWQQLQDVIYTLFTGFTPVAQPALRGTLLAQPAALELGDGDIELLLELSQSSKNSELRMLLCEFDILDPELPANLEGAPIRLLRADSGELEQEQTVEDNEAMFRELPRARYSLQFHFVDQTYIIEGIDLSTL